MASKTSAYWFKRRRYGWGWTPVTWQGWLVVTVFAAIVIASGVYLLPTKNDTPSSIQMAAFLLISLSAVSFLAGISYAKGPAPKWRWGKKASDDPEQDF